MPHPLKPQWKQYRSDSDPPGDLIRSFLIRSKKRRSPTRLESHPLQKADYYLSSTKSFLVPEWSFLHPEHRNWRSPARLLPVPEGWKQDPAMLFWRFLLRQQIPPIRSDFFSFAGHNLQPPSHQAYLR